ncbi:hypothetical protein Tco_0737009 [Tanacetum coccineum]
MSSSRAAFSTLDVKRKKVLIAGFQKQQIRHDDEIVLARVRIFYFRDCHRSSIKGNVTASKPQTLKEAITITQRCQACNKVVASDRNLPKKGPACLEGNLTSSADKSFVSISLASKLNIPSITLNTTYDIEMADGNLVGTNTVTLILLNQPFKIDLMPIKLGSFDVVIGMDCYLVSC